MNQLFTSIQEWRNQNVVVQLLPEAAGTRIGDTTGVYTLTQADEFGVYLKRQGATAPRLYPWTRIAYIDFDSEAVAKVQKAS